MHARTRTPLPSHCQVAHHPHHPPPHGVKRRIRVPPSSTVYLGVIPTLRKFALALDIAMVWAAMHGRRTRRQLRAFDLVFDASRYRPDTPLGRAIFAIQDLESLKNALVDALNVRRYKKRSAPDLSCERSPPALRLGVHQLQPTQPTDPQLGVHQLQPTQLPPPQPTQPTDAQPTDAQPTETQSTLSHDFLIALPVQGGTLIARPVVMLRHNAPLPDILHTLPVVSY